jgi:hypothetical protein
MQDGMKTRKLNGSGPLPVLGTAPPSHTMEATAIVQHTTVAQADDTSAPEDDVVTTTRGHGRARIVVPLAIAFLALALVVLARIYGLW